MSCASQSPRGLDPNAKPMTLVERVFCSSLPIDLVYYTVQTMLFYLLVSILYG